MLGDVVFGYICKKMYEETNDPPTVKLRHTLNTTTEDILILGNSRAECHFDPAVIQEATGMSAYNCGIGGADFLFSRIQLNESLKRYTPKLIIVEASPNSFFLVNAENRIKTLLPFYKRDTIIYHALTHGKLFEEIKFISTIYPYNSTIGASIRGLFKKNTDTLMGFMPAKGQIDSLHEVNYVNKFYTMKHLPQFRLDRLKKIIETCNRKKIPIVIVSSPVYYMNKDYEDLENQLKRFCLQFQDVHFFDYTKSSSTYLKKELFYDNAHLNDKGARLFTQNLSENLNKILQKSEK